MLRLNQTVVGSKRGRQIYKIYRLSQTRAIVCRLLLLAFFVIYLAKLLQSHAVQEIPHTNKTKACFVNQVRQTKHIPTNTYVSMPDTSRARWTLHLPRSRHAPCTIVLNETHERAARTTGRSFRPR